MPTSQPAGGDGWKAVVLGYCNLTVHVIASIGGCSHPTARLPTPLSQSELPISMSGGATILGADPASEPLYGTIWRRIVCGLLLPTGLGADHPTRAHKPSNRL